MASWLLQVAVVAILLCRNRTEDKMGRMLRGRQRNRPAFPLQQVVEVAECSTMANMKVHKTQNKLPDIEEPSAASLAA